MPVPAVQKDPRQYLIIGRFVDGIGLAGQMRFVHFQRIGAQDHAIDHQAIARLDADDLVFDHLAHGHINPGAITPAGHRLFGERRQLVQLALGIEFLDHADEGIGDDAEAGEESRGVVLQRDDDEQEAAQDYIK